MLALGLLLAILLAFPTLSATEPVQYCRFGHRDQQIDFCVGITTHHNHSTSHYDLYMSMSVTRSSSPALGWTAIGTGPVMAGSLMFIVYGDPGSGSNPMVSIRTVNGHRQPHLVQKQDMAGADIRLLQTTWLSSSDAEYSAQIALVCYSCDLWPGLSLSAASQPWIWAWNKKQQFQAYSSDAELDMHAHHAGNGGWGSFFVDMGRSLSDDVGYPSLPPIRPGIAMVGSWEGGRMGMLNSPSANPLPRLHGLCMLTAFLLLFPLGIVIIRSGMKEAFRRHWILQASAAGLVTVGVGLAIAIRLSDHDDDDASTRHQVLGGTTAVLVLAQSVAGYQHHVLYVRLRQRTCVSYLHIWLGRLCLVGGWAAILNVPGLGPSWSIATLSIMFLEAAGLVTWIYASKRRERGSKQGVSEFQDSLTDHFSLQDAADEEVEDKETTAI
ncbi:hypothetical protein XA68_15426 [Ophiocordyceps unilateralis]|uniref:Cytochrome b561 domain-containing protein n=1 Tax=Ophiocordyceps unilateralis TaxID=268505 RepID=A0A2A9P8K7_OPHUN|nr:hypothetical protein XA68_15426 [Ophiocordyceps unilateralis]